MVRRPTGEVAKDVMQSPLTPSLVVAVILGAAFVLSTFVRGESLVDTAIAKTLQVHCERDVDAAHPELPKRYVKKLELAPMIHVLERKQDKAQSSIEQLTAEVRRDRRERRRGR